MFSIKIETCARRVIFCSKSGSFFKMKTEVGIVKKIHLQNWRTQKNTKTVWVDFEMGTTYSQIKPLRRKSPIWYS